jgi:hypothetical protein
MARHRSRIMLAGLVLTGTLAAAGSTEALDVHCRRGPLIRDVEVRFAHDADGLPCEVVWQSTAGSDRQELVWRSDSQLDFCTQKARELAHRIDGGWMCASAVAAYASPSLPAPTGRPEPNEPEADARRRPGAGRTGHPCRAPHTGVGTTPGSSASAVFPGAGPRAARGPERIVPGQFRVAHGAARRPGRRRHRGCGRPADLSPPRCSAEPSSPRLPVRPVRPSGRSPGFPSRRRRAQKSAVSWTASSRSSCAWRKRAIRRAVRAGAGTCASCSATMHWSACHRTSQAPGRTCARCRRRFECPPTDDSLHGASGLAKGRGSGQDDVEAVAVVEVPPPSVEKCRAVLPIQSNGTSLSARAVAPVLD